MQIQPQTLNIKLRPSKYSFTYADPEGGGQWGPVQIQPQTLNIKLRPSKYSFPYADLVRGRGHGVKVLCRSNHRPSTSSLDPAVHMQIQRGVGRGSGPPVKSHCKSFPLGLEILLVWTTLEKQLDPLGRGPIAS